MANEKRLIDARPICDKCGLRGSYNCNLCNVGTAPTVDAVEVVYGEWIYHECVSSYDGTISGYSCSQCCSFVNEEIFDMDEFHKDFCGHCGAKMDGGNEDG